MGRGVLSLTGMWDYEPIARVVVDGQGAWREDRQDLPPAGEMPVPSHWTDHGLPDFHGRVRYSRRFELETRPEPGEVVQVVFAGVDYAATVVLNDHVVGTHEGYFQPFRFEVTELLREGTNHLVVEVTCPREEPGPVWPNAKRLLKGVLSHWDARPGGWNEDHGQDRPTGGIWNDVSLETLPAAHLGHIRVATRILPQDLPGGYRIRDAVLQEHDALQAVVTLDIEVFAPPGSYAISASLGSSGTVEQRVQVRHYPERVSMVLQIQDPRLWWTWDLGEPHLETCRVELVDEAGTTHTKQILTGLREIGFDPATGQWFLNGRRVFLRGTNVIPSLWLADYDAAQVERDIELLRDANVNGVRVCVHVTRPEFYEACDRAGILIWQDFALQWGYATDRDVMQDAVRQVRDMVRALVNHPSIALWCCQNESSFHNKNILDPVLAWAASTEDPSRHVRATSEFTEHTYPGWYHGHYRDFAALPATPVLTEFGGQALPSIETIREIDPELSWPPDWALLAHHNFQFEETFDVAGVELGADWHEFIANSQLHQADLLQYGIEQYRRAKYAALGGMFQFMFFDVWPAVTWSVLDHARRPKLGYEITKRAYQPVLVGAELDRTVRSLRRLDTGDPIPFEVRPWVVNDLHRPLTACRASVRIVAADGASVLEVEGTSSFDVPSDGVVSEVDAIAIELPTSLPPGPYVLELRLHEGDEVASVNEYRFAVPPERGAR
ncbi:MAG: hypothetical protein JJT89_02810 [Nitriliruptoraceae bacterium]|nr:hypothetical protein [Nitriliruptoraceae bacterium]